MESEPAPAAPPGLFTGPTTRERVLFHQLVFGHAAVNMRTTLATSFVLFLGSPAALPQVPHQKPDPALFPPPVTYRGLVPGRSTVAETRSVLGAPLDKYK